MARIVQVTNLTGDYSENELEALEEIRCMSYRGTIQQEDDVTEYYLVAFTFPRYGQLDRSTDGLRYIWVSKRDLGFA